MKGKIFTRLFSIFILSAFILMACKNNNGKNTKDPLQLSWNDILQEAKGQTLNFMMWQGDPQINKYINDHIVPAVKEKYGIN